MVTNNLKKEIEDKRKKLTLSPQTHDRRATLVRDSLVNLGDIYSFWIENPDLRRRLLLDKRSPDTVKKMARDGIRHIKDAWYFLSQRGTDSDFYLAFDADTIKSTNALINGLQATQGHFRKKEVTLGFPGFLPPKPERVPCIVWDVVEKIKKTYPENPLDAAIYAHLALALTQPFMSANKRTARLIQNRLLLDAGYPPAVIPAGEAILYFELLRRAIPVYQAGNVRSDGDFHNYVASKVNNGLDLMLGDLHDEESGLAAIAS